MGFDTELEYCLHYGIFSRKEYLEFHNDGKISKDEYSYAMDYLMDYLS